VQTEIGDRLARGLLSGEITDGSTVTADVAADNTGLTLAS
jgi:ATP-dependent Clp protease ATP-binding subunit ClpB